MQSTRSLNVLMRTRSWPCHLGTKLRMQKFARQCRTATMRTMQHLDKYMDMSYQRENQLCLGLQRALSDTGEYGCGPRCTSHCLMIFCRDNPEKANELHEAGSSIFRQYKKGFHAFGDDVQRASIRSSGVGAFRRKTNNCVKLLPVGNSTSSVEVVQPILCRVYSSMHEIFMFLATCIPGELFGRVRT